MKDSVNGLNVIVCQVLHYAAYAYGMFGLYNSVNKSLQANNSTVQTVTCYLLL